VSLISIIPQLLYNMLPVKRDVKRSSRFSGNWLLATCYTTTTTTTNVLIIVTLHKVAGALYISDFKRWQ